MCPAIIYRVFTYLKFVAGILPCSLINGFFLCSNVKKVGLVVYDHPTASHRVYTSCILLSFGDYILPTTFYKNQNPMTAGSFCWCHTVIPESKPPGKLLKHFATATWMSQEVSKGLVNGL